MEILKTLGPVRWEPWYHRVGVRSFLDEEVLKLSLVEYGAVIQVNKRETETKRYGTLSSKISLERLGSMMFVGKC